MDTEKKIKNFARVINSNPSRFVEAIIFKNLPPADLEISNLQIYFEAGITISTKLATVGDSSPVGTKEKIQKLIFPEGVTYNHQNGTFRTSKVNLVFEAIPQLNSISGSGKQKQDGIKTILSIYVGRTGLPTVILKRVYRIQKSLLASLVRALLFLRF